MIIGLTGGIASGKSTVSKIFRELGAEIIDADIKAKEISEREDVVKEIGNIFGKEVINSEGKIDRLKIKEIVFNNKEKLKKLNDLIHPKVMEEFKKIKENKSKNDIIIFDVPLLFESGMDKMCDKIILVFTDKKIQIKRMLERDGITEELAEKIINSQMSLEEKLNKSQIHLENNGTLEDLREKSETIYRELKGEK
ncbi:dephospho-CoA kinase [Fusobacterium perfoetens]|uniref:dephospho-CoA kinase n=1 Tax=Fusobacterium perfoetens TaxID=852 RepID=UPI001EE9F280|nr:dephospho-CoA kinase [Fusobacterium perfoetens]MCF2626131.1 dephospho-CoA kinase [Fusobacterium perfoetens]